MVFLSHYLTIFGMVILLKLLPALSWHGINVIVVYGSFSRQFKITIAQTVSTRFIVVLYARTLAPLITLLGQQRYVIIDL